MKKSAFLGEANWTANSVLLGLYHVWQAFHFFVNMWMAYGTS